jgi:dihydropyrimidinase
LRSPEDVEALWDGVRDGTIDSVGTDNVTRSRSAKKVGAGLHGALTGCPGLGTHLPILLEEGYHRRHVPLEAIAKAVCEGPARIFGLYQRKGAIAPGSDADLVVIDLNRTRVVRAVDLHSFSDFSLFEGRNVRGWPVTVIKGGEIAVHENEILSGSGTGHYLPRSAKAEV